MDEVDWNLTVVRGFPLPSGIVTPEIRSTDIRPVDVDRIVARLRDRIDDDTIDLLRARSRSERAVSVGGDARDEIVGIVAGVISRHATIVLDRPDGRWISISPKEGSSGWEWLFVDLDGTVYATSVQEPFWNASSERAEKRSRSHPDAWASVVCELAGHLDVHTSVVLESRLDQMAVEVDAATPLLERIDPAWIEIEKWLDRHPDDVQTEPFGNPYDVAPRRSYSLASVHRHLPASREGRRRWVQGVKVAPFAWVAMLSRPDLVEKGSSPSDIYTTAFGLEPTSLTRRIIRMSPPWERSPDTPRGVTRNFEPGKITSYLTEGVNLYWKSDYAPLEHLHGMDRKAFNSLESRRLGKVFVEAFNGLLESLGGLVGDVWVIDFLKDLPPALREAVIRDPEGVATLLEEGLGDFVQDLKTHLDHVDDVGGTRSPFEWEIRRRLSNGYLVSEFMIVERLLRDEGMRSLRQVSRRWHARAGEIAGRRAALFEEVGCQGSEVTEKDAGFDCSQGRVRWLDGSALLFEGMEMDHCVGSYIPHVELGFVVVASLDAGGHRATVAYRGGTKPCPASRMQFYGVANSPPPDACIRLLQAFEKAVEEGGATWPAREKASLVERSKLRTDVTAEEVLASWRDVLPRRMRSMSPQEIQRHFLSVCDQSPSGGPTTFLPLTTTGGSRD